jgi:hypothetical protein
VDVDDDDDNVDDVDDDDVDDVDDDDDDDDDERRGPPANSGVRCGRSFMWGPGFPPWKFFRSYIIMAADEFKNI